MTIEDTQRSELRAATTAHTPSPALDRTLAAGRTRRRRTTAAKALGATGLACLLVLVVAAVTGSDAPTRGDELLLAVPPEGLNVRIAGRSPGSRLWFPSGARPARSGTWSDPRDVRAPGRLHFEH